MNNHDAWFAISRLTVELATRLSADDLERIHEEVQIAIQSIHGYLATPASRRAGAEHFLHLMRANFLSRIVDLARVDSSFIYPEFIETLEDAITIAYAVADRTDWVDGDVIGARQMLKTLRELCGLPCIALRQVQLHLVYCFLR